MFHRYRPIALRIPRSSEKTTTDRSHSSSNPSSYSPLTPLTASLVWIGTVRGFLKIGLRCSESIFNSPVFFFFFFFFIIDLITLSITILFLFALFCCSAALLFYCSLSYYQKKWLDLVRSFRLIKLRNGIAIISTTR